MLTLDHAQIREAMATLGIRGRYALRVMSLTERDWLANGLPANAFGLTMPVSETGLAVLVRGELPLDEANVTVLHELVHVRQYEDYPTLDDADEEYRHYEQVYGYFNPIEMSAESWARKVRNRYMTVREA